MLLLSNIATYVLLSFRQKQPVSFLSYHPIQFFDPGEVLYLYESPPGYGIIFLRIIAWWMFMYSTIFTLKHYPEKARFYYPFNIMGTLW
jgi:hypothetical protein